MWILVYSVQSVCKVIYLLLSTLFRQNIESYVVQLVWWSKEYICTSFYYQYHNQMKYEPHIMLRLWSWNNGSPYIFDTILNIMEYMLKQFIYSAVLENKRPVKWNVKNKKMWPWIQTIEHPKYHSLSACLFHNSCYQSHVTDWQGDLPTSEQITKLHLLCNGNQYCTDKSLNLSVHVIFIETKTRTLC